MANAKVKPFLMFEGKAEEAMNFYISLFDDGRVLDIHRYGPEGPGKEGSVMKALFCVGGQNILCIDSFVSHGFSFTPAFSLFVDCESDDQIAHLTSVLSTGGSTFMPLDNYGFSRKFAWVSDRFGISWQLNLA